MEPDEFRGRGEEFQALEQGGSQVGMLLPVLAVHLDRLDLLLDR